MHVSELEIYNIRSFDRLSLKLSKGINLFIGPNNAGKSTILRSLQTLQQGLSSLSKDDVRKSSDVGKLLYVLEDIRPLEGDMLMKNIESKTFIPKAVHPIVYANWKEIGKAELFVIDPTEHTIELLENDIKIKDKIGHEVNQLPYFKGIPGREDENNFIYPFLSKRKIIHNTNVGGKNAAYTIYDGIQSLPSRIQNLSNGSHPHNKSYKALCESILGFEIAKVPHSDLNEDRIGIFTNEQECIFLESMGEGVTNILGLLSILLTKNNKLFLIEEIENDIHPKALKQLLDIIIEKSSSNQFVISTHSNIVLKYLASAKDAKVFNVESSMQKVETVRGDYNLPTSNITEIDNSPIKRRETLETLGYDLFDVDLYSSYIVFEESSAERIVRDFLIPTFVPGLQNKVRTIAAGGADDLEPRFTDLLRLFVFIHTAEIYKNKAWIIADGDEKGMNVIESLKTKFSDWNKENFLNFKKENFEEYYPEEFQSKVNEIMSIKDKRIKRLRKTELTHEILQWIGENKDDAKVKFENSAKEIISVLRGIESMIR